jgi:hypothetical protein
MSGLSDTAFEEILAETYGDVAAEPSPVEPESPEANVQTESETATPDEATEPLAASEEAPVAEVDPRQAEIERREQALIEREAQESQRQLAIAAQWQQFQEKKAEEQSIAYAKELAEVDPALAQTYVAIKQSDSQKRRDAEQRAYGAEQGLTAAMIALETSVSPEVFSQVLQLTEHLAGYPDANQMQAAIAQERQRATAQSEKEAVLEATIKELRLKLDAQDRPVLADAVDRGSSGPGSGTRLEDAPDFDTFFEQFSQTLAPAWR